MDLYATCDRDGYRRVIECEDAPEMNVHGEFLSWRKLHMTGGDCKDLPDFPAPGEFKKVTRLSILPLEIEYEKPPFVGKVWACTDKTVREVRVDIEGDLVYIDNAGFWRGGRVASSDQNILNTIPNWPDSTERRELRCVPTLSIEWADEPKQEKPRFDPEMVERVVNHLDEEFASFFRGSFANGPRWDRFSRDLCALRDQMNSN